MGMEKKWK